MPEGDLPASLIHALALAVAVTAAAVPAEHANAQDPAPASQPAADSSNQTQGSAPAVDAAPQETTPAATEAVRPLRLDETPPPQPHSVGGGYVHQFSASTGDGSDMSADRFYGSFSSR
ncbi:MAG: hypothetical protein EBU31_16605, partial [Proteobacteria bacterium]|nr:hypothetical protein [Pseudomonadota bacterium]